jgi:predicted AlkP superfamily pyrophosphatase or phosphodiesterase
LFLFRINLIFTKKYEDMKLRNLLILSLLVCTALADAKSFPKCKHVILIGVDGFGSQVIRDNPGRFKNIEALMQGGCWTLESRSVLPSSSAINWKTMISGGDSEMHGYTQWNTKTPDLVPIYTSHWGMYPSIFGVMRDQNPTAETGVIFSWDGIGYIYEKEAVSYNKQCKEGDDVQVKDEAVKYIRDKQPNLLFVYFSNPDEIGHKYGWYSKEYNAMCDTVDAYVGQVIEAIKANMNMKETAILFSSDHGGKGKGHGGMSMLEMQTPFVIYGDKLPQNYKMEFTVMRYDIAATIADLLRIEAPDAWRGKSALRGIK